GKQPDDLGVRPRYKEAGRQRYNRSGRRNRPRAARRGRRAGRRQSPPASKETWWVGQEKRIDQRSCNLERCRFDQAENSIELGQGPLAARRRVGRSRYRADQEKDGPAGPVQS